MDIYWFLRLHDFLWGGGVPSSPPCFSSLLVPVSPTLWVRKLAPVLLPAVALLHPELARPTVLLPTNVSSTVVPALPATSVLVMSIMVAVPPMEAVVVMVVVAEVPHGSPASTSRTSPEASPVEVLIWRRTTVPVVRSPSVVGRSSTERWSTVLPGGWWLLVEVPWRTISWEFRRIF